MEAGSHEAVLPMGSRQSPPDPPPKKRSGWWYFCPTFFYVFWIFVAVKITTMMLGKDMWTPVELFTDYSVSGIYLIFAVVIAGIFKDLGKVATPKVDLAFEVKLITWCSWVFFFGPYVVSVVLSGVAWLLASIAHINLFTALGEVGWFLELFARTFNNFEFLFLLLASMRLWPTATTINNTIRGMTVANDQS